MRHLCRFSEWILEIVSLSTQRPAGSDPIHKRASFPADTIHVAYETLDSAGPVIPQTVDRRRSLRQERHVPAWLSDASGGQSASSQQEVRVTNLSLHGVGFNAPKRVDKDDAHWIVISSDCMSLSTRLRVVSVRKNEDGRFDVGAEFF